MDFKQLAILARAFCLGLILSVSASPSWAVHDLGTFELDGNATDDPAVGDDWENIYNGTSSAIVDTEGIIDDPAPKSIFTGGRKDIQDIDEWSHKDGSVPDKDDLTHAAAAAYAVDNDEGGKDLVLYVGAARFANVGDAFLGFWFFQNNVEALPDGSFKGQHVPGDVLILIDYPQGANAEPYAALVVWDPTCSKADSNDPVPGECAAKNLRLQAETSGENPANCNDVNDGDFGCAITNSFEVVSPWPYTAKDGTENAFPFESFYEGGINLSQLLPDNTACFSTFMAETRSSSSFTASLKDFVLGDFTLCDMTLSKTCPTGVISPAGDSIIYDFEIELTNTGFGTLYDIEVVDVTANQTFYLDSLPPDETATFEGSFVSFTQGVLNKATAVAAIEDGGEKTLEREANDPCPVIPTNSALTIDKECTTYVEANSAGEYGLRVNYQGEVCNAGNVRIDGIQITEVHDGMTDVIDVGTLGPNSCADYSGTYIPAPSDDVSGGPVVAHDVRTFSDTVVASGTDAFNGPVDTGMPVEASCPLCPAP